MAQESSILKKLESDLKEGKKCVLAYSKSVENGKLVKTHFENMGKKVLFIHRLNKGNEVLDSQYWMQYDLVMYSPTISEGYSFDERYFDMKFVIASTKFCPPKGVAQMIARVRHLSEGPEVVYGCVVNDGIPNNAKFLPTEKSIWQYLSDKKKALELDRINIRVKNYQFDVVKDELWDTFVHNKFNANSYIQFERTLYQCLIDNGYRVFSGTNDAFDSSYNSKIKKEFAELKGYAEKERMQNIIDAKDISESEYKRLSNDMFLWAMW